MYGPVWTYLWKTTFITEFPLLKSNAMTKEICRHLLVTPDLLAFIDTCMATAHYAQNIQEAEQQVSTQTLVPKYIAKHAHSVAKQAREKIMQ